MKRSWRNVTVAESAGLHYISFVRFCDFQIHQLVVRSGRPPTSFTLSYDAMTRIMVTIGYRDQQTMLIQDVLHRGYRGVHQAYEAGAATNQCV